MHLPLLPAMDKIAVQIGYPPTNLECLKWEKKNNFNNRKDKKETTPLSLPISHVNRKKAGESYRGHGTFHS